MMEPNMDKIILLKGNNLISGSRKKVLKNHS